MLHQEWEPPHLLRDTIRCFWYDQRDYGAGSSTFEVLPDGHAEIIFHFGSGCSILTPQGIQPLPSPFIMGLLNRPVTFQTTQRLELIAIRCFPWTVFDLLGLPSGKDSIHLLPHPIAQLQPILEEHVRSGRITQAIDCVQQYSLDARVQVPADSMLARAGAAMREANGSLPVSEVAAAAHATVRTLQRNFRQSSGHTVKDVSALMRFEQVRNRLWLHPHTSLAGLAQELGYADQSHLSKEFRRYSGTTPAAFARKARQQRPLSSSDFVAFVQDGDRSFAEFCPA